MNAQDVMTKDPKTCGGDDTLADAIRVMREEDCGLVPIIEGNGQGRVIGVVTDRDAALLLGEKDAKPSDVKVRDAMSREIVSVAPGDEISEVTKKMEKSQVRRILVCENERLLGVISTADIALEARSKETGRILERISEPNH